VGATTPSRHHRRTAAHVGCLPFARTPPLPACLNRCCVGVRYQFYLLYLCRYDSLITIPHRLGLPQVRCLYLPFYCRSAVPCTLLLPAFVPHRCWIFTCTAPRFVRLVHVSVTHTGFAPRPLFYLGLVRPAPRWFSSFSTTGCPRRHSTRRTIPYLTLLFPVWFLCLRVLSACVLVTYHALPFFSVLLTHCLLPFAYLPHLLLTALSCVHATPLHFLSINHHVPFTFALRFYGSARLTVTRIPFTTGLDSLRTVAHGFNNALVPVFPAGYSAT